METIIEAKLHAVGIYTDKSAPAVTTDRISVVSWKMPKDAPTDYKKPVARFVSIPKMQITVQPNVIAKAMQAAFEDLQDEVIRNIIENALDAGLQNNDGSLKAINVSDDQISLTACAAYFDSKAVSGKLSKKLLEEWFDSDLASQLEIALIAALKMPDTPSAEQQAKLDAAVAQHKTLIVSLASPRASMNEKLAKQLQRAVKLAEESKTKASLDAKLLAFLQPKEVTLDIGLGE